MKWEKQKTTSGTKKEAKWKTGTRVEKQKKEKEKERNERGKEEKEKVWKRFQDVKDLQQNPFQSFLASIVRVLCDRLQCARLR